MIQQVSDAELEIIKIIWANNGTALFAMIMKELEVKGRTWQKNTVITLLSHLTDKGLLKAKKIGRRNEYIATISEAEYQTAQTKNFLNKVYEGDVRGLVSNLIQSDLLTCEEYKEFKEFWNKGANKNG